SGRGGAGWISGKGLSRADDAAGGAAGADLDVARRVARLPEVMHHRPRGLMPTCRRSATAILVPLVLACWTTGCESTPSRGSAVAGTPVTAPTATMIPAQPSNPGAQATPSAGWERYTNSRWGYSLNFPQQWYSLANNGAPDTDKYFSSENVG